MVNLCAPHETHNGLCAHSDVWCKCVHADRASNMQGKTLRSIVHGPWRSTQAHKGQAEQKQNTMVAQWRVPPPPQFLTIPCIEAEMHVWLLTSPHYRFNTKDSKFLHLCVCVSLCACMRLSVCTQCCCAWDSS